MASKSKTGGALRRSAASLRYKPYDTETNIASLKEEVIRLGVKLSLSVAESMFLLCDDLRTMLCFCFKLWRRRVLYRNPVSDRLLRVIHKVYSDYIKPKNGVFQDDGTSVQWELIRTTWKDFAEGIMILYRLVVVLRRKDGCSGYQILWPNIALYKQMLKRLEGKLRSAKDVSEANGFSRETVKSDISIWWKSIFDEEETGEEVIRTRMVSDLFKPILGDSRHSEILESLPVCPSYILGVGFAKQELKEDVVRLGVELSLLVAQFMLLLCDDIRTMLWFCYQVWRYVRRNRNHPDSAVVVRMLRVMHYVYLKDIKPKNGVYHIGSQSDQLTLMRTTWENFGIGFRGLDLLVLSLRGEGACGQGSIEQELKKVEEKLECVKGVSEANGFARDALESTIMDLWKSLLDEEAKEARCTLKAINREILRDLFLPIQNELAPPVPPP